MRLAALSVLLATAAGFTKGLPGGLFRPVEETPFINLPARLSAIRATAPVSKNLSGLVAVAVVFSGQALRVESNNLTIEPPVHGTIADFLHSEDEPHQFRFLEVRNLAGVTLGYLLARDEWLDFVFIEPNGRVFLSGKEPSEP